MKLFICLFFGMFNLLLCAQTDFDLAENYYDKGEFEKALFIYQKLHKEAPSNSNFAFRIIEVQQELQHFEEADAFINHQLSLRNNPQMLVEMGYNFQLQNKLEQASVYFKKAIAIAKATPAFCYSIALRFEEHSLVDEAIEVYKLAINQTNNTSYEYRLSGLYAQKKDVQNMFLSYLNFTENNPTFLSQVYRLFGDYISENPDAEYNQILRKILLKKLHTSPSIFWSQMLSWLYTQQKDYQKALLQEKSIFRRNPSSLQGVINVGFRAKSDQVYDVTVDAFNFIIQNAQDSKLTIETHRQLIELELIQSSPQDLNQIQSKYNNLFEIYGRSSETLALQLSYAHFLALYLHNYPEAISFLKTAINTQLSANELGRIKLKLADVLIIDEQFNKALLYYAQVYTTLRNSPLAQEARFKSAKASYYSGDFEWAESQLKVAPNCFGDQDGELEIQTVGGAEYFLNGTSSITNTFNDLGAGTYLVEVTDINGCTTDTTVTIDTNSPEITLDVNFTNTVVCFDQALEFIATAGGGVGDFTYNWYQDAPPPGTIYDVGSPLEVVMDEELLLFVVAYDANGCPSDTLSMEAVFSTPVSVSASPTALQTICIGQCVDVNAIPAGGTGPIEVTWVEDGIFDDDLIGNDPNYTVCPEESINFVVFADDGCAPVASDTVFVTVNPAPDVEFTLDVDFGCLPLEVNFINETPDASTTCFWDFGDGTILNVCEDVTYVYEEAGTFFPSLNITSDQGCTGTDLSLTPVNVYGFPEADFYWDPVPVTTLENEVSLINTSTDGVSYLWEIAGNGTATTEDVEITFAPVDLAEYEVCLQTTNMFGCTDTLCQTISMQSELLVYVPNAFTPNNDGLNDLLTPSVLGLLQSTYHFQVFDRWGHIVFESYTEGEGWNGSFQNGTHYVQEDVYLWRIEGQDVRSADVVTIQGHVTVVR